jgi:protein phosphatase
MAQNSGIWEDSLEHAALSDIGLRRTNNQDAMAVVLADSHETWQQRGHLFVVADGMGAHAAG